MSGREHILWNLRVLRFLGMVFLGCLALSAIACATTTPTQKSCGGCEKVDECTAGSLYRKVLVGDGTKDVFLWCVPGEGSPTPRWEQIGGGSQ